MNVKVLPYSSVDDHAELGDSLVDLVELVESSREELRKTGNW